MMKTWSVKSKLADCCKSITPVSGSLNSSSRWWWLNTSTCIDHILSLWNITAPLWSHLILVSLWPTKDAGWQEGGCKNDSDYHYINIVKMVLLIKIKIKTETIDRNQNRLPTWVVKCLSLLLVPLLNCDNHLRSICTKNGKFSENEISKYKGTWSSLRL